MPKRAFRRALIAAAAAALTLAFAGVAGATNYIVLYKSQGVPADGGAAVRSAGGNVVASYPQIGVLVAESSNAAFASTLSKDNRVQAVSSTERFGVRIEDEQADGPPEGDLPNQPATDADTFSALQWDMDQIQAPEAHAITGGSPAVLVGDLDTGLDWRHPDLRDNVDLANSVSCVGGVPNQDPAAWDDDNGHGTHTAGTIAAASNGAGIVGVAPKVRIAGVKVGNAGGFFYPEAVVCGFMWAAAHGFDVTNNSYFADPFYFNCHNDSTQQAIWKAEARAIKYAQSKGVTVVAALGNFRDDLAHPTQDVISPDDQPTAETRSISNNCVVVPTEVPGVIGVTATGVQRKKASYSNYGVSVADVAAPGGDAALQPTADPGRGRVLSTWPNDQPCARSAQEPTGDPMYPTAIYCWIQGTSMASPHVAGLAALVISLYGDSSSSQNGKLRPGQVASLIQQTADGEPCPDSTVGYPPSMSNGAPQTCTGGTGSNSWFGKGIVNALSALEHTP